MRECGECARLVVNCNDFFAHAQTVMNDFCKRIFSLTYVILKIIDKKSDFKAISQNLFHVCVPKITNIHFIPEFCYKMHIFDFLSKKK